MLPDCAYPRGEPTSIAGGTRLICMPEVGRVLKNSGIRARVASSWRLRPSSSSARPASVFG
jgi:hypothetical protein